MRWALGVGDLGGRWLAAWDVIQRTVHQPWRVPPTSPFNSRSVQPRPAEETARPNSATGHAASRSSAHAWAICVPLLARTEPPCEFAGQGEPVSPPTHSPQKGRASRVPVTRHPKVSDASSVRGFGDRTWSKRRAVAWTWTWTWNVTRSERWRRQCPGLHLGSGCSISKHQGAHRVGEQERQRDPRES